ncbi:MAG: hypothetical protein ACRDPE_21110 [Solirubrobacterales bacterium]
MRKTAAMNLGLCLPQLGPTAERAKVAEVARRAEEVGYDSLWVGDRLLTPESPQDLYPVGARRRSPTRPSSPPPSTRSSP